MKCPAICMNISESPRIVNRKSNIPMPHADHVITRVLAFRTINKIRARSRAAIPTSHYIHNAGTAERFPARVDCEKFPFRRHRATSHAVSSEHILFYTVFSWVGCRHRLLRLDAYGHGQTRKRTDINNIRRFVGLLVFSALPCQVCKIRTV